MGTTDSPGVNFIHEGLALQSQEGKKKTTRRCVKLARVQEVGTGSIPDWLTPKNPGISFSSQVCRQLARALRSRMRTPRPLGFCRSLLHSCTERTVRRKCACRETRHKQTYSMGKWALVHNNLCLSAFWHNNSVISCHCSNTCRFMWMLGVWLCLCFSHSSINCLILTGHQCILYKNELFYCFPNKFTLFHCR